MFSLRVPLQRFLPAAAKLALASLIVTIAATAAAQTMIQARKADQFVDSMGINVHMEYGNTPYKNYAAINERLLSLGMRHFRDEINDADPSFVSELRRIGELGYTLCGLIEGGNDYPPLGTKLEASAVVPMIRHLLPTIVAVEGPNEPDNSSFAYDGVPYPQGAINESEDLWKIVKGSLETRALPVVVMSEGNPENFTQLAAITPPPIDYATYGNMHAYQAGGVGDHLLARLYIPYSRDLTGSDRLWTTEMGYHNNTQYLSDEEQQGVSQRASAIYLPIAFLSGFNHGVMRTFCYELIDESYDPDLESGSGEGHYGLLNYDGSPKPAYSALKNLIALLRERKVKDFQPGSLRIDFSGAPSTMGYTLLEKSSGHYYLALWNDIKVYRTATSASDPGKDLYPPSVAVTLRFSAPQTFVVYAPNDPSGVNPTNAYTISVTTHSIQLELPAKVLLIKIAGKR
jgi:hypothetical protein